MKIYLLEQEKIQHILFSKMLAHLPDIELIALSDFDSGLFEIALDAEPCILISGLGLKKLNAGAFIQRLSVLDNVRSLILLSDAEADILESIALLTKNIGIGFTTFVPLPIEKEVMLEAIELAMEHSVPRGQTHLGKDHHLSLDDINDALYNQCFVPYFQPQVDAKTHQVVAFELLGRLHFNETVLFPGDFIPQLLDSNLITNYTFAILQHAIRQAKLYEFDDVALSVNIDYMSLMDADFAQKLIDLVQAENFDLTLLEVEVTETSAANCLNVVANLVELRLSGMTVSIDDFGTGFSGINELMRLPFNQLKLDRSHVARVTESVKARQILKSLCTLANNLNLKTVAEGVETQEQAKVMEKFGADRLQGFLFSPAVKAVKVPQLKVQLALDAEQHALASGHNVVSIFA